LDLARFPRADVGCIHHGLEAAPPVILRDDRFADGQEMWAEAADRLLEDDLEESACNKGVGKAEDGVRHIVEAADAGVELAEENYGDGDERAEETGGCCGEDGRDVWVGEVWIDNVTGAGEGDGEVADAGGVDCPELKCRKGKLSVYVHMERSF
jgi:hypothetical protein